ncbi:MAG: hypothetical protein A3B30_02680 [Candidatus Komeilibacteria bacterium RIFCSPLOWO2_01_FULL_52_15]|uniref:Bacterial sugar transferase domain-containing protein n=2 Tax=Candidatus Komeiliibacteriota TaxID=1817908 RepID=A0A1G2BMA2_9BACT|nr:MAG: hypothetical protein A2677_04290 [Candidatus Komeilibacteria bacterium RIFCSPHIGHO2_01_FULL_52_14]OGY90265.1 MAG: hypothetical protein A3B30_02680 [Candidatus Komeilibacteria bacterium RIFCSPLOWO2_01_FULL_52_15]
MIQLKKVTLVLGDTVFFYIALYLTVLIRYRGDLTPELWWRHVLPFTIVFALWLVVFFVNNLYSVQIAKNDFSFYNYLLQNLAINTLIGFTFFYLTPTVAITSLRPFRVLLVLILIYALLFLLWRLSFYRLTSHPSLSNRVMLIGLNRETIELAQDLEQKPQLGYKISLIANLDQTQLPITLQHIPHIKELTDLSATIQKHRIQTVVTTTIPQHSSTVSRYLFETLNLGLTYYNFTAFYEKITGRIPVGSLEKSWFIENLLGGTKRTFELIKRLIDIISVLVFGTISLLLLPFIVVGIKLTSPGPLLYKQIRTGKGGTTFTTMKFRSMVTDAEQHGPQFASKNDSRVTKFGRFLRKSRLDEIPQFINILAGDMTFVGPRPERPEFVETLSQQIPFYKERLLVKPGLTGWAQINYKYGDSVDDAMRKLQYDLFYIKNRSFTLDVSIILKTLNTIFNRSLGQ